jgi:hypothetical protein
MLASPNVTEMSLSVCAVISEIERRSVELHLVLVGEHFARNAARWRGQEIVVPVLDPLNAGKMLAGVILRDDPGAGRMQPRIAVGMIEMPMRVDEVGNGLVAERGERFGYPRPGNADAGVDHHLAVGAGQHRDVAAGSLQRADVVAQLVGRDRRGRSAVLDQGDEAARFGIGLAGRQPSAGRGVGGPANAAQAEAATRHQIAV